MYACSAWKSIDYESRDYSNDYPVERYLRNCRAAMIHAGTRDIHTLMQADWALGLKKEKPARKTLPPWKAAASQVAS